MRDINAIASQLGAWRPEIILEQIRVKYPGADEDGLWFVRLPGSPIEVQLESSTGTCPFLVEFSNSPERLEVSSVTDAFLAVLRGVWRKHQSAPTI
jgi:hypothetical protein